MDDFKKIKTACLVATARCAASISMLVSKSNYGNRISIHVPEHCRHHPRAPAPNLLIFRLDFEEAAATLECT